MLLSPFTEMVLGSTPCPRVSGPVCWIFGTKTPGCGHSGISTFPGGHFQ